MIGRRAREPAVPSWADRNGDDGGGDDWGAAGPVGASTRLQAVLSRGLAFGLWGVIGLALVLGLVNCAQTPTAAPAPAPDAAGESTPVPPPGGCAELVVAAWVTGDTGLLEGIPAATGTQPEAQREATRTYTAAVDATAAPHSWSFLVAAELRERAEEQDEDETPDGWRDLGVHYFAVTMTESRAGCQGWAPATMPMQVAPPELVADEPLPYTVSLANSGTELSDTLAAFFGGLLAGAGDLERYVAPGVQIPAVTPPPYREVSVTELRAWTGAPLDRTGGVPPDGTTVRLLATVHPTPAALPLVYPVTVSVRGGRWEVVAIDPTVAAPQTAATPVSPPPTATSGP